MDLIAKRSYLRRRMREEGLLLNFQKVEEYKLQLEELEEALTIPSALSQEEESAIESFINNQPDSHPNGG